MYEKQHMLEEMAETGIPTERADIEKQVKKYHAFTSELNAHRIRLEDIEKVANIEVLRC